jgi:hypothetical protein
MSNGGPAGANVPQSYVSKQTDLVISPPGYTSKKFTGKPKILEWTSELAKGTGNFIAPSGIDTDNYGNFN